MANYIIIGGDNKEYGPVSEEDVRQWISEGRLNAQSRVKAESDAEFRSLAQFPEFAIVLGAQSAAVPAPRLQSPDDFLDRDYEIDIGGCIQRGWELYKANFGILFGAFVLMLLMQIACGSALGLVRLPFNSALMHAPVVVRIAFDYFISVVITLVTGPLVGGLNLVYLKTIRGQATGISELFAGFQRRYLQLFLGMAVVSMVVSGCLLPFQFVWQSKAGPLLEQMQAMQSNPTGLQNLLPQFLSSFTSASPVFFICLIPMTFFMICFQFTMPLIIDKEMDFGTAMKTSWKMVLRHWWQVFGLVVVAGLVSALGLLGCCIGVFFTAPIGMAAVLYAYETIFGAQKN